LILENMRGPIRWRK